VGKKNKIFNKKSSPRRKNTTKEKPVPQIAGHGAERKNNENGTQSLKGKGVEAMTLRTE